MKRWMQRSLLAVLLVALAIQAFRPLRANPTASPRHDMTVAMNVDPVVANTLQRSCRDCHSNQTRWPWYSHVAPVSWMVARDVNNARWEMNLSTWGQYSENRQQKLLGQMCETVREGEMPESTYTLMHREALLSQADVEAVCAWTQRMQTMAPSARREVED